MASVPRCTAMKKAASAGRTSGSIGLQPIACAWHGHDKDGALRQAARRLAIALLLLLPFAGTVAAEPLTDGTGRTQEVAAPVTVAVPAGAPAQILLHALAPGKLGALVEGFAPEHAIYVDPRIAALPQVAMLTRSTAPGDVAAVAALKPGLVVDYGSLAPRYVAASEKIGQELHAPAVLFSGDLADAPRVARTLAGPLGEAARGEAVAAAMEAVLDRLKPLGALPDGERVPVYVARGADGLTAARAGTSFDEPIRLAGGRNVVTGGGGTFRTMTAAEVAALKPAVVVVSDLGALHGPLRDALPKETRFVWDAGEPYKVLTAAPSLNRIVGAAALAALLHPEVAGADPDAIRRLETTLFPIPPGLAVPAPLQVRD